MSAWTDLGLPYANAKGYGYARDASIIRDTFVTFMPNQSQRNENWRKTIEVSWNLTLEQLALAENYLLTNGYSWFELELVTNETPFDETISLHNVRLISNYKVSPIGGQLLKLNATLETKVIPQTCNEAECVTDPCELVTCDYAPIGECPCDCDQDDDCTCDGADAFIFDIDIFQEMFDIQSTNGSGFWFFIPFHEPIDENSDPDPSFVYDFCVDWGDGCSTHYDQLYIYNQDVIPGGIEENYIITPVECPTWTIGEKEIHTGFTNAVGHCYKNSGVYTIKICGTVTAPLFSEYEIFPG